MEAGGGRSRLVPFVAARSAQLRHQGAIALRRCGHGRGLDPELERMRGRRIAMSQTDGEIRISVLPSSVPGRL